MVSLFFRQFIALFRKNWIVLSKHPILNLLRCFIGPIAFGVFMAVAQIFLTRPNNFGFGTPLAIPNLQDKFDGSLSLIWADGTDGTASPKPEEIMARITTGFPSHKLRVVKKVESYAAIQDACPQNFNWFSVCFAGIYFDSIPVSGGAVNYTIKADGGLTHIDVPKHKSDVEKRILPLQWAIDKAIIELKTGTTVPTPSEWPYSIETNEEQRTHTRLSYTRGIRNFLVIALFVGYIGIAYQLPGAYSSERAISLTPHLKAMGLLDSARMVSWILSLSLAYLPAWIIVAIIWHYFIFSATNAGLILVVHLLCGLSLASYSLFIASFFGKSPQLSAVISTFFAIILAITAVVFKSASSGGAFVFTLIFPPGFYVFAIRAICGFENHRLGTVATKGDPDYGIALLPIIVAAVLDCFIWPYIATLVERLLYDGRNPKLKTRWAFWRKHIPSNHDHIPPRTAVSIRNLEKTYPAARFGRKSSVTAIANLTLDVPKTGIFVLLGSNGAGKSTALSIIGGLLGRTSGSVIFEGNIDKPPRGTIGIVPQKNVLIPELSCLETLQLWWAVKWSSNSREDEDLEQLLRDCDLEKKINKNADTLSGGQKRKLQLAIGLVGGSKIVLVDECTSGVDPLSRRALWRTLSSYRHERTIIFTTHFLDEADLLADRIAILAAPGKLVAEGTPVVLKRTLGEGYTIQITFNRLERHPPREVLEQIREFAPHAYVSSSSPHHLSYHLKSGDTRVVESVLKLLERQRAKMPIESVDVLGTTIEDIFLDLMRQQETPNKSEKIKSDKEDDSDSFVSLSSNQHHNLQLTSGRRRSPLQQAFTIFHKRALVFRRSWLSSVLAVGIAVAGSCIPLVFITVRTNSCVKPLAEVFRTSLYLPNSPFEAFAQGDAARIIASPPGIIQTLGSSTRYLGVADVVDNNSFTEYIKANYRNITFGGISIDQPTGNSLFAWEASVPGLYAPTLLNLVSNVLFNRALNATGNSGVTPFLIQANYEIFAPIAEGSLNDLKWSGFFSAAISVFPAFFALYVSRERRSSVQAMQFSNGLSNPAGLWLGHLLFDSVFTVIMATIIMVVFGTVSNQFHGLFFFWFIMIQYGMTGTLFAYCSALVFTSPLACFAAVAGYQIIMFILYQSGYLLTLTYAKTVQANQIITIYHFTTSWIAPIGNLLRASFVSVNLFSLLCDGSTQLSASSYGDITRYGGPILYFFVYGSVLFGILVWVDSGKQIPWSGSGRKGVEREVRHLTPILEKTPTNDVLAEARAVTNSNDILRIAHVSKSFEGIKVVEDLSVTVSRDMVFAMLGPNGAGKTTTFNIIRGDIAPDSGDVIINGNSAVHLPRLTRLSLGVCPQFTAIDSQLTVREHLVIYGRLKGLNRGAELRENVEGIMRATSLVDYDDRLASKLSGGNQRKLMLAIALIGNPSVVLIDEFSTGIDAKMKREIWDTLRKVAKGKAVVITTHSMEEASALANKVGIIAKKMLAVGSTSELSSRYAAYEVHFSCRSREEVARAQTLMARVPGAILTDDVATRFDVPISVNGENGNMTLAELFHELALQGDFEEYTVEKATLESVFLKVIRENNVLEEDTSSKRRRWRRFW